ncbi:unnamed protein product [Moneuplotes crassus]|uniref:Uncharacterized protein n=1 Tax=Euplotes crassus TaxID=5936 RepID=A0AAD1UN14_EUPCR|nr:unnamed protein product [Moneuplotes crassus]
MFFPNGKSLSQPGHLILYDTIVNAIIIPLLFILFDDQNDGQIYTSTFMGCKIVIGFLYVGRDNLFRHYLRLRFFYQQFIVNVTIVLLTIQNRASAVFALSTTIMIIIEELVLLLLTYKYLFYEENDQKLQELMTFYKQYRNKFCNGPKSQAVMSRVYKDIEFTDLLRPTLDKNLSLNFCKTDAKPGFKIIRKPRFALFKRENEGSGKENKGNGFTHERNFSTVNGVFKNRSAEENSLIMRTNEYNFRNETQKRLKLT